MKAVRIIKVIAFVVAIISLLLAASGNFFIIKDTFDYEDVTVSEVKDQLDKYDFNISSLTDPFSKASAEGEFEAEEEATDEGFEAEETVEEAVEETVEEPATEEAAAYSVSDHENVIVALMTAGAHDVTIDPLSNIKCVTEFIGEYEFSINLYMLIFFIAITLAFILHLISKKRRKTVYGILLMVLGYIIFLIEFALGYAFATGINVVKDSFEAIPLDAARIYIIAFFTFKALLFGVPYVRCGSRQMHVKYLKARLKKKAKKAAEQ